MSYIVIEKHGGAEYAIIVTDVNGENKVFDKLANAKTGSADCQDGLVIKL